MATPEGKVKDKVKAVLRSRLSYWHMPVQNGMGQPALDFHVCMPVLITPEMVGETIGVYVGIETKKPGGKLTPRQINTMAEIAAAGGKTFMIDGDTYELETWEPGDYGSDDRAQRDDRHRDPE